MEAGMLDKGKSEPGTRRKPSKAIPIMIGAAMLAVFVLIFLTLAISLHHLMSGGSHVVKCGGRGEISCDVLYQDARQRLQ
jgi:hypothetical protein